MYCINRRDRCRFCERGCALLKNIMSYTPQVVFGGRRGAVPARAPRPPGARTHGSRGGRTGEVPWIRLGRACAAESEMRRESVSEYTTVHVFFLYTDERLHTCELNTVVRCVRRWPCARRVVHT